MLMALGQFVFQLPDLAYHELHRSTAWRHPGNSRVGAREARQYVGPGEDTITLNGVLVPEIAGKRASLSTLRTMADTGDAFALVDGTGNVLGAWVIDHLQEGATHFTQDGIPRRTEFTISLARTDDGRVQSAPPGNDNLTGTVNNGSGMRGVA
jgi:phage protein U